MQCCDLDKNARTVSRRKIRDEINYVNPPVRTARVVRLYHRLSNKTGINYPIRCFFSSQHCYQLHFHLQPRLIRPTSDRGVIRFAGTHRAPLRSLRTASIGTSACSHLSISIAQIRRTPVRGPPRAGACGRRVRELMRRTNFSSAATMGGGTRTSETESQAGDIGLTPIKQP